MTSHNEPRGGLFTDARGNYYSEADRRAHQAAGALPHFSDAGYYVLTRTHLDFGKDQTWRLEGVDRVTCADVTTTGDGPLGPALAAQLHAAYPDVETWQAYPNRALDVVDVVRAVTVAGGHPVTVEQLNDTTFLVRVGSNR